MSVQTTTVVSLLVANVALVQSSAQSMWDLFTLAVGVATILLIVLLDHTRIKR